MIKASELRIGNYVIWNKAPDKKAIIVKGIAEQSINSDDGYNRQGIKVGDIEGIPLTFDIFGDGGIASQYFHSMQKPNPWDGGIYIFKHTNWPLLVLDFSHAPRLDVTIDTGTHQISMKRVRARHLHELQNLFYSLTGEELLLNIKILADM